MTIARKIEKTMESSSWIRKMFEAGAKLKAEHGAENVFDFSLGNPNLEPPKEFQDAILETAQDTTPGLHGYMPNAGYPHVRESIAQTVSNLQGKPVTANDIIMTCGAAGGLNIICKALLNPGEEVLVPTPYFVEYGAYADNHGGTLKTVNTREDFSLDIDAMANALTDKTRIVLINSPNNPTGAVYTRAELTALGDLLREKSKAFNRNIYLVSDEPYTQIVFDDTEVPPVFEFYEDSLVVTSHSKDLSLAGERIGYVTVNPEAQYRSDLINAMTLVNRTLGFVNAPAMIQRVLPQLQGASVNVDAYRFKRDLFCKGLKEAGYTFDVPKGTFYLFVKSPIKDDVEFVQKLQDELILAVPGSGFGGPGYFRLAFCVDDNAISGAMPGFKRAMEKLNL
ncbi:MAG: pyridoxal phosphate-dependent aminotransferase [Desulfobacterales bacterium]|nr:pyridoxal phosphate-dependent aminotransferase [Desulfobacterales bacterium]